MIALDTNVLVRYLVEDDVRQSAAAVRFIERAGAPLFVTQIVMCELVWVLSFAYDVPRREIVSLLHQLRRAANLVIESADQVQRAIDSYGVQRGDFADYLIAERAQASGCTAIATFDRALLADQRFLAVP
ncbi:MAG TPA: type II toxin-antitoxin system VapC family toxin [Thermoanaerobaculia bacterium]|nr:type II toxin-antitoxin system VapC family toxin [Thermoanaerobaculia bacterium]